MIQYSDGMEVMYGMHKYTNPHVTLLNPRKWVILLMNTETFKYMFISYFLYIYIFLGLSNGALSIKTTASDGNMTDE
jgi:hypothetical protein